MTTSKVILSGADGKHEYRVSRHIGKEALGDKYELCEKLKFVLHHDDHAHDAGKPEYIIAINAEAAMQGKDPSEKYRIRYEAAKILDVIKYGVKSRDYFPSTLSKITPSAVEVPSDKPMVVLHMENSGDPISEARFKEAFAKLMQYYGSIKREYDVREKTWTEAMMSKKSQAGQMGL